jgi:hypothetical protein
MDYLDWKYMDLKKECAKRNLGGGGKAKDLINKLVACDNDMQQPKIQADEPPKKQPELSPESPNPDNPNFDMAGRWRRRPIGFISWEDEALKEG